MMKAKVSGNQSVQGTMQQSKDEILTQISSRMEATLGIFDEVLKEHADWRRELRELRLAIPIFEGKDVARWLIKVEEYFEVGGVCKEENQIP